MKVLNPIDKMRRKIARYPGSTRHVAKVWNISSNKSIATWRSRFNVPEGGLSIEEWTELYPNDVLAKEAIA